MNPEVMIWQKDASEVDHVRKLTLSTTVPVGPGPSDARVTNAEPGIKPISPDRTGSFLAITPGTPEFDAVHMFAVVHETLALYDHDRRKTELHPWQWSGDDKDAPLQLHPRGLPGVANAYYDFEAQAIKCGYIESKRDGRMKYFCRSFDVVAHETGHAILDGLKPGWGNGRAGQPTQTRALHESFGDLTAMFLQLNLPGQVELFIKQTGGDLHKKNFIAEMGEQIGLEFGLQNGLRNADRDKKMSEADNEEHDMSEVFTGAVYDILADMFAYEQLSVGASGATGESKKRSLMSVAKNLRHTLFKAIIAAPDSSATFSDVAFQMLQNVVDMDQAEASADRHEQYRKIILEQFQRREVKSTPSTDAERAAMPRLEQDRESRCGTMKKVDEYHQMAK